MNKIILFLVFVLMITTVTAQDYKRTVVEEAKYTISGTVVNDYNEGRFPIDEGISGVFEFIIDEPVAENYSIYFISDKGDEYQCVSHILSNDNDTVYDNCVVYPKEIGQYTGVVRVNGTQIYVEKFKVVNSSLSALFWVLAVFSIISGIVALYVYQPLLILSVILFISAMLDAIFTYKYLLSEDLFLGFIGLVIAGLVAGVIILMYQLFERN